MTPDTKTPPSNLTNGLFTFAVYAALVTLGLCVVLLVAGESDTRAANQDKAPYPWTEIQAPLPDMRCFYADRDTRIVVCTPGVRASTPDDE